jgi:hypothetical protein
VAERGARQWSGNDGSTGSLEGDFELLARAARALGVRQIGIVELTRPEIGIPSSR